MMDFNSPGLVKKWERQRHDLSQIMLKPENILKQYEFQTRDLLCKICFNLVYKAKVCMKCECAFCERCILMWKSSSPICPQKCEGILQLKDTGRILKNILDQVEIKCQSCDTIVKYENYEKHFINECTSLSYKCLGWSCDYVGSLDSVKEHVKQCHKLPQICHFCNCAIPKIDYDKHVANICPRRIIECECGLKIPAQNKNEHTPQECLKLLKELYQEKIKKLEEKIEELKIENQKLKELNIARKNIENNPYINDFNCSNMWVKDEVSSYSPQEKEKEKETPKEKETEKEKEIEIECIQNLQESSPVKFIDFQSSSASRYDTINLDNLSQLNSSIGFCIRRKADIRIEFDAVYEFSEIEIQGVGENNQKMGRNALTVVYTSLNNIHYSEVGVLPMEYSDKDLTRVHLLKSKAKYIQFENEFNMDLSYLKIIPSTEDEASNSSTLFESIATSGEIIRDNNKLLGENSIEALSDISLKRGICCLSPGYLLIKLKPDHKIFSKISLGGYQGDNDWVAFLGVGSEISISATGCYNDWQNIGKIPEEFSESIVQILFDPPQIIKYIKLTHIEDPIGIGYLHLA